MTDNADFEKGPLERLLGAASTARILDHLYTFREFDYSISEIAEITGLSRRTVQKTLERLMEYEVVTLTRTVGRAKMFRLKMENPIAQKLRALIAEIAAWDAERTVEYEAPTYETAQAAAR